MHRIMTDSKKVKLSGETKAIFAAKNTPAIPAQADADHKGQQLQPEGIDAHGLGGDLVLADRDPCPADARGHQPVHGEDRNDGDDQDQIVEIKGGVRARAGDGPACRCGRCRSGRR